MTGFLNDGQEWIHDIHIFISFPGDIPSMFEKVIIPFNFLRDSHYAIECLKENPELRQLVLLHIVYNKYPSHVPGVPSPEVDYARLRLEELVRGLELPGVQVKAIVEEITGGEISGVLSRIAREEGSSLVVMGRRGRGLVETMFLGSGASDVLRHSERDLLLVHAPGGDDVEQDEVVGQCPWLFSHVLICTDFSEPDIGGICHQELPWIQHAVLFHAVTPGDSPEEMRSAIDSAHANLETMKDEFLRAGIPAQVHVCVGSAAEEILTYSEQEDVSLIILKSAGKKGFLTELLGSTAEKVARNTGKPVLILKRSVR
jgi:nucleotide-binding universal stress UspA family protein